MTKPAAIMGMLTDLRNIAANKSVRLSIEVPAERAREVIDVFGWATSVEPIPVAIARLATSAKEVMPDRRAIVNQGQTETQIPDTSPRPTDKVGGDKPKRAWGELSPAQQCGIRCNDPSFRRFLAQREQWKGTIDLDMVAHAVREECGVDSRSQITPGSPAASRWHQLDGDYEAWLRYGEMA